MERIGWIGTGVMGRSMVLHVLQGGHPVSVFNRSRDKADDPCRQGAAWCETPGEVAARSDIVFTMVGEPSDVEEVILGGDGVLARIRKGSVIVDMTTSEPSLAVRIYGEAKAKSVFSLDAPVSGGDIGAKEGTLAIMAGGDEEAFRRVLPVFERMGGNIAIMGGPGMGQHTKMSNQILVASTMIGVVEALLYARRAGLDLNRVIEVVGKGAAASWAFNKLGPRIVKGDTAPGFAIRHFVKDMGIALTEAKRMKLALPGLALVNQFYLAAVAEGLENEGTHALFRVLDRMNSP
ncbi:MAG: oxidoreductase [Deltaproteobacteria bacterium HGW-Deltaproteobacteria-19]|nr:MAG: oxidoreductase [Deltaproteobacteria bacterium HGW-Deltaproteobacteria-19]